MDIQSLYISDPSDILGPKYQQFHIIEFELLPFRPFRGIKKHSKLEHREILNRGTGEFQPPFTHIGIAREFIKIIVFYYLSDFEWI
jgi:hypothetical protein